MNRPNLGSRKGFTLLELLVVLVVGLLVLAVVLLIIVPGGPSNEHANRVKCASNLRQIGQALMFYANDHKGADPQVRYKPGAPLARFTGAPATQPFAENGPKTNDVTAALFLLIRTADLNPEVFVCPTSNQDKDDLNNLPPDSRSNFKGQETLSYSYAHPYPDDAAVKMGYKLDDSVIADFVIAADRNECQNRYKNTNWNAPSADFREMNSVNHEGEGQNVMFNDGHVEWCTSPFVGVKQDHIYTRNGVTSGDPMTHQPENPLDTILLPTFP